MWRKPFYATAGVFSASHDLSWIPDAVLPYSAIEEPLVAPDGTVTTFTFNSTPRRIYYNGLILLEDIGFTLSGNTATIIDVDGNTITPEANAIIRAFV